MNGFVVGLKQNCPKLLLFAEKSFAAAGSSLETVIETDARGTTRTISIVSVNGAEAGKNWAAINKFICVQRKGIRHNSNGKKHKEKQKQANAKAKKQAATAAETAETVATIAETVAETVAETRVEMVETAEITATVTATVAATVAATTTVEVRPVLRTKSGKPRCRNAVEFTETSYYAVSKTDITLANAGQVIRGHWGLKNDVHRTKDVVLNEDKNKIKNKSIAVAPWRLVCLPTA